MLGHHAHRALPVGGQVFEARQRIKEEIGMAKSGLQQSKSPSQLIDERIKELAD